jgi:hypothetical protein
MSDGIPGDDDEASSKEAFMAAIMKLADDEAFRRSFLTHYQLWLHPPMIVGPTFEGVQFNTEPGGITFLSEEQIHSILRPSLEVDESRANIERIMSDSGGAP